MRHTAISISLGLFLTACGSSPPGQQTVSSGTTAGTTSGTSATSASAGTQPTASAQPAIHPATAPLPAPQAVSAPDGTWTWINANGAVCANGNATGFAVNLQANSNELLVIFEGGGECGDATTCFVLQTASYVVSGYDGHTFASASNEQAFLQQWFLTDRTNPSNPYANMNWAYIPYCTGDLHAGNNVATYSGAPMPVHHVGAVNAQIYLNDLAATLPNIEHIWLAGGSAGGFGAMFNYERAQKTFPNARVDAIDDSGSAFSGIDEAPSWNLQLPSACANCANDFPKLVQYLSNNNAQARFGVLSYTNDTVLPLFFGITPTQFQSDLSAYEAQMDPLANVKYFVVSGSGHVVLLDGNAQSGGVGVANWVQEMVQDSAAWTSEKP